MLFVCPTNKLASNYKGKGITLNKFFGVGLTEDTKFKRFDCSAYDTVVFDEIFFASLRNLRRIKRYCDEHPEKIIIATGDTEQLESIDPVSNQKNYDDYSNFCVNLIFPHGIQLKENKRLKTERDKKRLAAIKKDVFDRSLTPKQAIQKHFSFTKQLTTKFNIAYKNKTCGEVNQRVRAMLRKRQDYEVGEVLVCRRYTKLGRSKITFNVNYEYTITAVREATLQLDEDVWLPLTLIKSSFTHNYCRTCHSFQGSSVDEGITILIGVIISRIASGSGQPSLGRGPWIKFSFGTTMKERRTLKS